jgi:hypothetical protein
MDDLLARAATEAMRDEQNHMRPCTVAAKWEQEERLVPKERAVLKTSHGQFTVEQHGPNRVVLHYQLSLCEFIPGTVEDGKAEIAAYLLPQLEEVLDEVRLLAGVK